MCNQISDLEHQIHIEECEHNVILLSSLFCETTLLCTYLTSRVI